MKQLPNLEFKALPDLKPGCGFSRYWSFRLRSYGQTLLKEVFQELPEDFDKDPWDKLK